MSESEEHEEEENDPEGRALWAFVTKHIKPFPDHERPRTQAKPRKHRENTITPPAKTEIPPQNPPKTIAQGREIDKRLDLRLHRGQIPVDARLDLHGMTREEAREHLINFVINNYKKRKRLLLVITGKGRKHSRADDENNGSSSGSIPGILRQRVPLWLDEPPLSSVVLQYCPAKPADGGEGALYVLLRRQRT